MRTNPVLASSKKGGIEDKRISVCVPCNYGIFKDQEYIWTKEGYIHKHCVSKGLNEVKTVT